LRGHADERQLLPAPVRLLVDAILRGDPMIYLTGDTHGRFERIAQFCDKMSTTKEDVLIILGDAGINFYCNRTDQRKKEQLSKLPITLLCIHGNHERRPESLGIYGEQEWHGGIVYVEERYPNILFAKDGEVYDLNGKKTIVIGGAYSIDKARRIEGLSWWPDEQPSEAIKERVEKKLEEMGWKVDIVLSHTTPLKYEPVEVFIRGVDQSKVDKSTELWLESIENRLEYQRWYCAHYHTEKTIDRMRIMFKDYTEIESEE